MTQTGRNLGRSYDQIPNQEQESEQISPYFKLMTIVGTYGRYQCISITIWVFIWLVTGNILLGTSFFMLNEPYICQTKETAFMKEDQCQKHVCQLPYSERQKFINQNSIITIANSFQDLHCDRAWLTDLMSSLVYFGSFLGYISISIVVDNFGRRKGMLFSYGVATLGMIIAATAFNLQMVAVGLILMGYGSDSAINICFYFITETMEQKNRQKYCIFIQIFFCLGGITNIGYFYLLKNWKFVFWVFMVAPSLLCLIAILLLVKQTPFFLIKLKENDQIYQDLNQIYKINNAGQKIPPQKQIQLKNLIKQLKARSQLSGPDNQNKQISGQNKIIRKVYSPVDLFRYSSIRFISVAVCIISTFIYLLYYSPLMLISKLRFSIYVNALVVTSSQLFTFPFSYFFIHCIPRQKFGIISFAVCAIATFALFFNIQNLCQKADNSEFCKIMNVTQLVLIFILRFFCSMEFAIFLVYTNQVFPTQVRGLGLGVSSALGTVASTLTPYIFGSSLNTNSATAKIMLVFFGISLIGFLLWFKLPQTLHKQIRYQIQQEQNIHKQRQKQIDP